MKPQYPSCRCTRRLYPASAAVAGAAAAVIVQCTAATGFTARTEFRSERFSGDRMTGQRVLVLSLCTPRGYDTGATTDPRWQAVWLKKEKGPFVPVFRSEIETRIDERCDTSRVDSFFNGFCDGDILSMQQWDCIWEMLPAQYILVSRIRHGSSIRGFDAGKKRKIHIESEVWNTRERVVVWRCNVRGMNTGGRMDETRFVRNALLSGLRLLPPLLPAVNENVW